MKLFWFLWLNHHSQAFCKWHHDFILLYQYHSKNTAIIKIFLAGTPGSFPQWLIAEITTNYLFFHLLFSLSTEFTDHFYLSAGLIKSLPTGHIISIFCLFFILPPFQPHSNSILQIEARAIF